MAKLKPVVPQPLAQPGSPQLVLVPSLALPVPHVEVFRNAALSIPNGLALTNLPFDSLDSGATSSPLFNLTTGVFTAPVPGRYLVRAFVDFNVAAPFRVVVELLRNGSAHKRLGDDYSGAAAGGSAVARALSAGDAFQVQVAQNSATNPGPLFVGSDLCYASFEYIGSLA